MAKKKSKSSRGVRTIPTQNSMGLHPMFFKAENVSVKVITDTPLDASEIYRLRAPIDLSYIAMCEGRGTATDWYNIAFRLHAGVTMGNEVYVQETMDQFKAGMKIIDAIRVRSEDEDPTKNNWNFLPEEIPVIFNLIEAVDAMQLEVKRSIQLAAYKSALAHLEVFRDLTHDQPQTA